MSQEELVFQLLEEERKIRTERIAGDKKITTEDCLVLGILRLNREMEGLHKRIDETNGRIDATNGRIDATNGRIDATKESLVEKIDTTNRRIDETKESLSKRIDSNFKWIIALILGMWVSIMTILIAILLSIPGI
jgi:predicted  nucleic acid-binding Zn-ribbon protein